MEFKAGQKIYWLSWDGKHKGEYTIATAKEHITNGAKPWQKLTFIERKKGMITWHINNEINECTRFNLHEHRRYFANELLRNIFEKKVQPYLINN